jgi:hypothetical protein
MTPQFSGEELRALFRVSRLDEKAVDVVADC